jgi:hypothetical protein
MYLNYLYFIWRPPNDQQSRMFANKQGSTAEGVANGTKEKIDDVSNIANIRLGALLLKKKLP